MDELEQELERARTREDLAAALRDLHVRADSPSLRKLERWSARRKDLPALSKSTVSDVLKGTRLPKKAVLIAFVQGCGVRDPERLAPWRRAWERVAAAEQRRPATENPEREQLLQEAHDQAARIIAEAEAEAAAILAQARERAAARPAAPAPVVLTMPALGEDTLEGTVTRWFKSSGDRVEPGEPLVEVSVDKVDTELRSPGAGILHIHAPELETVPVGRRLAVIFPPT